MGKTLRAPARAVAKLLLFLAASLVASSRCPADEKQGSGDDLPAAGDQVRCPDCNDDGKMPCPTCAGKGELSHVCEKCKGTGRRPCPVCHKEETAGPAEATTPGRVPCDACGGKGTVGTQAKACARCSGSGTLSCTTCSGKGTLTCRKVIYDRICPTCGFVGKVTCTTCDGTTLVSPAVLAARRATAKKAEKPAARAEAESRPDAKGSPARAAEKTDPGEPPVVASEFPARYAKLTRAYESHADLFAEDPKPKLDPKRRDAAQILKQLPPTEKGQGTFGAELDALLARIDNLRKRWTDIRGLFDTERASYSKTKSLWESRESKLNGLPGHLRDEAEEEFNKHLDLVLRITEKHSLALEREEPAWMGRELANIESTWPVLKAKGEAKLQEAARAEAALKTAKTKRDAAAAAARATAKKSAPGKARASTGGAAATKEPRQSLEDDASPVAELAAAGAADDDGEGDDDSSAAPRKSRGARVVRRSESPAQGVHPAAWAIAAAGVGAGAYWFLSRSRKNAPDPDAPPAVS